MSAAFEDAARLAAFPGGYVLAYGSHATGTHRTRSDLDLLYTGAGPITDQRLAGLIDAVKQLHARHGLDLDEEVPFETKLYATLSLAKQAAAGGGFTADEGAPTTVRETAFLTTTSFRIRLVFNVLTTPNVFLAGNAAAYRRHTALAERAAARLAHSLHGAKKVTVRQAAEVLLRAPDGRTGKDYLGYLHPAHLHSVLARGFADLTARDSYKATAAGEFQPVR
ncbi:nucleotidyltransferase domain-containing protein [Kitasatospora sp. NPDC085895]|uniref:nucleotidyltransferase domain-containing protein n=1 Tax=Kitasatospora sp. NPDC085895 TaxID=3155057 RepID=UPI00344C8195